MKFRVDFGTTRVIQITPPFIVQCHSLKSVYNINYLRTPCEDVPIVMYTLTIAEFIFLAVFLVL
jgi:hypothetical protein